MSRDDAHQLLLKEKSEKAGERIHEAWDDLRDKRRDETTGERIDRAVDDFRRKDR